MADFEEIKLLSPYNKEDNVLKITMDSNSDTYRLKDVISKEDTYTFTIWYKSDSQAAITFNILGQSFEVEATNKWNKFIKNVTIKDLTNRNIDITPDIDSVTYYYEAYLVRGTVDSSWTPAPEDTDDKMKVLSSKIEQTSEYILNRVENTEKGFAELKLTADGISTRVEQINSDLSSEIKQTAETITNKVEDLGKGFSQVTQEFDSVKTTVSDLSGKVSGFEVSIEGIKGQVKDNKGNIATLTEKADQISQRVENVNTGLGSQITQTAESIRKEITSVKDGLNSKINQTAGSITSKVEEVKGQAIKDTQEQFYQSTSPGMLAGGSWVTTQLEWEEGKYIWRRNLVTKGDGTQIYTPSEKGVCITGNPGRPGEPGKGIKFTTIMYQEGTSATTPPTGQWLPNPPVVSPGKYLWSKTVITYTDNSESTTYGVTYIPNPSEGTPGQGVESIVPEYYISTSKTEQVGGNWQSTMPQWEMGKYLWTRYKITYKNPTSVEYTEPACDSSWEAVNDVKIGARNFVLKSNTGGKSGSYTDYLANVFDLSTTLKAGETYTIQVNANTSYERKGIAIGLGGDSYYIMPFQQVTQGVNTYTFSFTAENNSYIDDKFLNVYCSTTGGEQGSSPISGTCEVLWIKLETGNKGTDWSPAPEDFVSGDIFDQTINGEDGILNQIAKSKSEITQLSNSISHLVTDENGNSLMTQTSNGWEFNIGGIKNSINDAKNSIDKVQGSVDDANKLIDTLDKQQEAIEQKTAVINITTVDGKPAILLGQTNNSFKLRITNTSIDFIEDSTVVAYISNKILYIEKAVIKNEIQIGEGSGFAFRRRANNNMGIRWVKR